MNPRTVHAVAAALVEVTNTAANPAVTESVAFQAAQHVTLLCPTTEFELAHPGDDYCGTAPTSSGYNPYVVPQSESFIVTAIDIHTWNSFDQTGFGPCTESAYEEIFSFATGTPGEWDVPANVGFVHLEYPTGGIVFGPGTSVGFATSNTGCYANAIVYGI
jgi:hypothetical protein